MRFRVQGVGCRMWGAGRGVQDWLVIRVLVESLLMESLLGGHEHDAVVFLTMPIHQAPGFEFETTLIGDLASLVVVRIDKNTWAINCPLTTRTDKVEQFFELLVHDENIQRLKP